MTVDQLPGRMREFANYLDGLLARLDQGAGWCAVFWQRDPDGMRACLDGREIPPWDVMEALLQDLAADYGPDVAAPEKDQARSLHAAALNAHDARPGARDALGDRLDVMLREQRYAAERQAELGRLLASATTREQADAVRLDLAWARDDHDRATARCAELRSRIAELDRRSVGGQAAAIRRGAYDGGGRGVYDGGGSGAYDDVFPQPSDSRGAPQHTGAHRMPQQRTAQSPGPAYGPQNPEGRHAAGPEHASGPVQHVNPVHGVNRGPGGPASQEAEDAGHGRGPTHVNPMYGETRGAGDPAPQEAEDTGRDRSRTASPDPAPEQPAQPPAQPAPKQRKRRWGGARYAGMVEEEAVPVVVAPDAVVPVLPEPPPAAGRRTPRGARFAGVAAAEQAPAPEPRVEPVGSEARRQVTGTVETLARLRAEGRSGEAHVLLVEAAYWPADHFPLLAAEMQRAGFGADWATLLWEAASLPAERLVAAADALAAAGRTADGEQILRQGVARPATEIGQAVLGLAREGREREVRALLDAYVRVRTPEEAARSAEPEPQTLVPLLLEAAQGVSEERHWDLVHALRVAGFAA
ncbi:proline-rich domain-containing protein [Streptomyces sp. GESEQ-4]|uniref:proline-rich domain-containing protein n=1 Tax=Streptomyces sp. GESEQ-4 TaxID=2812655 RepID=UPI001B3249EC|nr:proline-rich domain-containing protein [Streptomyces sp. GESEQ-4]